MNDSTHYGYTQSRYTPYTQRKKYRDEKKKRKRKRVKVQVAVRAIINVINERFH